MRPLNLVLKIAFAFAAISIFLIANLLFIYTNPYSRNGVKVAFVMPEFIQKNNYAGWQKVLKFRPLLKLAPNPIVKTVTIPTPKGPIIADLWLPNENRNEYGAVIATIGVEVDRKDIRSTFLANNISRLGVAVLIPEVPGLIKGRFINEDSEYLVASFKYLETQPFIKKDKIGFLAYCGSSIIAMIAAENPDISDRVSYIAVNNLFYDSYSLYRARINKVLVDPKGISVNWYMHPKTIQIMNREFIEALTYENDKKILIPALVNQPESILYAKDFPPIPATLSAKLSPDGQKVHRLLVNKDPSQVENLLSNLPESVSFTNQYKTNALANLKNLKAPLFVIADRGNTFQPFTDSHKFVSLMPKNQYTFLETSLLKDSFLVQDLNFKQAVTEGVKIFFFATKFLMHAS